MSLIQRLNEMEEVNKALLEYKKEKDAPNRSFLDKLTGKNKPIERRRIPKPLKKENIRRFKNNYAIIIYLLRNGYMDIFYAPIQDGLIFNKKTGLWHSGETNYVYFYKKFPCLIIPEWSTEPMAREELYRKAEEEGSLSMGQKVTINALKSVQYGALKKGMGKMWIILIIVGIVAVFVIMEIIKKMNAG